MEPENNIVSISETFFQPRDTISSINSENSNIDTGSTSGSTSIETSKSSIVWNHFVKDTNFTSNKKVTCKYCNKKYTCCQGSTTNLHLHLKKHHPIKLRHIDSNESINIMDIFTNTKVNIFIFINFIFLININLYIFYI